MAHTPSAIEQRLLGDSAFSTIDVLEGSVPDRPGLYAIKVLDAAALPEPFRPLATGGTRGILYLGKATGSLRSRILDEELRAKGHGTFFRSIGAILGYRPAAGSLAGRANQFNYVFSSEDRSAIRDWLAQNVVVSTCPVDGELARLEAELIRKHTPLLNIEHNPLRHPEVIRARDECRRIARGTDTF
jgi:hypothetical protein